MGKDLSNETVFILAVLAILISILGAVTVFYETAKVSVFDEQKSSSSSGVISLNIVNSSLTESSSSGHINLDIVNNNLS